MRYALALLFLLAFSVVRAQNTGEITAGELREYGSFLASDSLKGRKPGTKEMEVAAQYILRHFVSAGLKPMARDGLQPFEVVTGVTAGSSNTLRVNGTAEVLNQTFVPLAFSASGTVNAPVVFAGYGFSIDADSLHWNDYNGVDVKGKWVMIFRGDPEPDDPSSRFIPFSEVHSKVLTAKDNGAAGVLLGTPPGFDNKDKLMPLVSENNEITAGIPVINIRRDLASRILSRTGFTPDSLENMMARNKSPMSLEVPVMVEATVDIVLEKEMTANVVAMLEGADALLKDEYIVVGAHYDHLGYGGPESGSRMPDTVAIHPGADDNASGTAMIMALAGKLAADQPRPRRSILFVAFSAEETGLIGSKYFISHCPIDPKSIKAMFNFDMTGRFDPEKNSISVSGTGTSPEADSILKIYEKDLPFGVVHAPDGYGPSDHAAFYAAGIPVFFFTTGVHTDYHTPFDRPEKLDYTAAQKIGDFAASVIRDIACSPKTLTFKESGSRDQAGRGGRRMKVTLGILPDFAGTEKRGLRVDGVTKEGPADRGGILKGDIITSVNGLPVGNIYDYMARLSKLKRGMTVSVEVMRNGKNEILLIQL